MKWKPTAAELLAALRAHYLPEAELRSGAEEWSLLTEVPSTGSPAHLDGKHPPRWEQFDGDQDAYAVAVTAWRELSKVRTIDVLLVRNWSSKPNPYERIAVEVKISRADFRRDTEHKRAPWQQLAHRFAYCVPEGLVSPDEVPDGCWLIEVSEVPCVGYSPGHQHAATRVHWNRKVRGTRNSTPALPNELAVALARRASRAEARLADGDSAGAANEKLRRLSARVTALEAREHAARDRVRAALALTGPLAEQVCAGCGEPIKPVVDRWAHAKWQHRSGDSEVRCAQQRSRWGGVVPLALRVADEELSAAERESAAEAAELRALGLR